MNKTPSHHAKYTCRNHTQYLSQRYDKDMIEFFLDSFGSMFNDRNRDGFPLIIEIRNEATEDSYDLSDTESSLAYSFSSQIDDETTIFMDENDDNISYGTDVGSSHTTLEGTGYYSEDDSVSRSRFYPYAELEGDNYTIMEEFSIVTEDQESILHSNVINSPNGVSYEKQNILDRSKKLEQLRKRLRGYERSLSVKSKLVSYELIHISIM